MLRERIAGEVAIFPIEKPQPALRCCVRVVGANGKIRICGKLAFREVKGEGFCGIPEHTLLAYQRQREVFRLEKLTSSKIKKYNSICVPEPMCH